jgi:5-methylcytosine-specific restriction protein A
MLAFTAYSVAGKRRYGSGLFGQLHAIGACPMTKAPRLTTLRPRVSMASQRLQPRPKTAAPVYSSPEWRSLIASIIQQRGRRCEDPKCQSTNRAQGQRVYGDHVVELQDGGALLDPSNIMLRCASCHGRKTTDEKNKRMSRRW